MLKLFLFIPFMYLFFSCNPTNKNKIANKKVISVVVVDSNAFKTKIEAEYAAWLDNEIKENRIQKTCPEYGSEEFQKFIETDYSDENRFAYSKVLKKLYSDFNQDGITDGLYILEKQDCAQGNGYVGDLQRAVIVISKDKEYEVDNSIIDKLNNQINSKAVKYFMGNVAYIEIQSANQNLISGEYWDWKEGDPTGQPSIKKNFNYDYQSNKISISNL